MRGVGAGGSGNRDGVGAGGTGGRGSVIGSGNTPVSRSGMGSRNLYDGPGTAEGGRSPVLVGSGG